MPRKKMEQYLSNIKQFYYVVHVMCNKNTFLCMHGLRKYVTYGYFLKKLFEDLFSWLRDESELKTQTTIKIILNEHKICPHNCKYNYKLKANVQISLERKQKNNTLSYNIWILKISDFNNKHWEEWCQKDFVKLWNSS